MDIYDARNILITLFLIVVVLPVSVSDWRWVCGKSVCKEDEFCEIQINGGTCFKLSARVMCGIDFYCYKPNKCCGRSTCCPVGYTCRGSYCAPGGRSASDDEETTNGLYAAAAAIPMIILVIVVLVFLCKSRPHDARPTHARVHLVPIDSLLKSKTLSSDYSRSSPGSKKSVLIHPHIVTAPRTKLVQADYHAINTVCRLQVPNTVRPQRNTEAWLQATNTESQRQATNTYKLPITKTESLLPVTNRESRQHATSTDEVRLHTNNTESRHQPTNTESRLRACPAATVTMGDTEVQAKHGADVHL